MGQYLNEARHHANKIEHYYKHVGSSAGYSQALPHYQKLSELMRSASRSKNDQSDAQVIQEDDE